MQQNATKRNFAKLDVAEVSLYLISHNTHRHNFSSKITFYHPHDLLILQTYNLNIISRKFLYLKKVMHKRSLANILFNETVFMK